MVIMQHISQLYSFFIYRVSFIGFDMLFEYLNAV